MRNLTSGLAALLPACCIAILLTFTPLDSTHTFGIVGADPVCAQEDDAVVRCLATWEINALWFGDPHPGITAFHNALCPAGTKAHCQVACNANGDYVESYCMCFQ